MLLFTEAILITCFPDFRESMDYAWSCGHQLAAVWMLNYSNLCVTQNLGTHYPSVDLIQRASLFHQLLLYR